MSKTSVTFIKVFRDKVFFYAVCIKFTALWMVSSVAYFLQKSALSELLETSINSCSERPLL